MSPPNPHPRLDLVTSLAALVILALLFIPALGRARIARNELEVAGQLDALSAGRTPTPEGIVEWGGYLVQLDPDPTGSGWRVHAWPRIHGQTGIRAFSVRRGGPVLVTENQGGQLDGRRALPPPEGSSRGSEGPTWRPLGGRRGPRDGPASSGSPR